MNLWDEGLEEKFLREIELPNEQDELKKQVAKDKCEFFLQYLDYKLDKDIIFSDVSLDRNDNPILRNINLTITYKKSVAIVGESGAGKTTIFRLFN